MEQTTRSPNDLSAVHRDLGRLEGRLTAVERELSAFKADFRDQLEKQAKRLDEIYAKLEQVVIAMREDRAAVKAGWWTALNIGGLVKVLVAAVAGAAAALGIHIRITS